MPRKNIISNIPIVLAIALAIVCLAFIGDQPKRKPSIFLPGTEPGQADTAAPVSQCKECHQKQVSEWSGSMMAHAPKDPLFNAMLSITEKYMMGYGLDVGEYCLRCHSPSGWLAGRSHPQTVEGMYGSDLDGIHCDACHRMTNPMANDGSAIIGDTVPGYGDGMYAVQRYQQPIRGKRGVAHAIMDTHVDPFLTTSEFCGVCHEVSNPYLTPDARHTPPHLQKAMERTYSEWQLSWYATRGEEWTCQGCHMKKSEGKAASVPGAPTRLDVASHSFMGGNTFAGHSVLRRWNGVDSNAIQQGYEGEKLILSEGLKVDLVAGDSGNIVKAKVRLTNLTGHKIPTGFPEGRRMWIELIGTDRLGNILFQSGKYDSANHDLQNDSQLKVYQTKPGISHTLADSFGVNAGVSFVVPLNDTVYFDNRIPPRGFQLSSFTEHQAQPVGYFYADGQYWDETEYLLPAGVDSVEVIAWYQVASKEFIEFARNENRNNPYDWNSWGEKVYQDWLEFGLPVEMNRVKIGVSGSFSHLPPHQDVVPPLVIRLAQNYPNPFNPQTTIEFWISSQTFVSLKIYDYTGKEVENLVAQILPAGSHSVTLNSIQYSSGVYFYQLQTGAHALAKKMLVLK